MQRPGTVRGPGLALTAFWVTSRVAKSAALLQPAASCAIAGNEIAAVTANGMTAANRKVLIFSSSTSKWIDACAFASSVPVEDTPNASRTGTPTSARFQRTVPAPVKLQQWATEGRGRKKPRGQGSPSAGRMKLGQVELCLRPDAVNLFVRGPLVQLSNINTIEASPDEYGRML